MTGETGHLLASADLAEWAHKVMATLNAGRLTLAARHRLTNTTKPSSSGVTAIWWKELSVGPGSEPWIYTNSNCERSNGYSRR